MSYLAPTFLINLIDKTIKKYTPPSPAFTWIHHITLDLTWDDFRPFRPPNSQAYGDLLRACTNLTTLMLLSHTDYYNAFSFLDPLPNLKADIERDIKVDILESIPKFCEQGCSLKTLIIDLRLDKIDDLTVFDALLRWLIPRVKAWVQEPCGDKFEVVGRFWGVDWKDIAQRTGAKALRHLENSDEGVEGVADLFVENF